jgi:hypothetical protein
MGEVRQFPSGEDKPDIVKSFLNKPMHETTIADTLIIHAASVLISEMTHLAVYGWVIIMKKGFRR